MVTSVETRQDSGIGAPSEQRQEFLKAFREQGWARPGVERPTARTHVTLIVATVATLFALLAGVAMQLIKPVPLKDKTPAAAASPAAVGTYAASTGWDCTVATDRGFTVDGRQSTWVTIGQGGWAQDGCHGDFEAVPFAGTGAAKTPTFQWWFRPPDAMKRCQVLVFTPVPDTSVYQPVHAATYSVLDGSGGAEIARFTVDQTTAAGTWTPHGTYPVGSGGVTVQLSAAGLSPSARAGIAVAQVTVRCTAA
ncbi:hypothetical protein GCM10009765_38950 [Fodinicola feengrottensis]|uniref:Ig-like domain-containing protein n=2 Tax=Fodinicola feengrottensis TaxID=435914 RepID=A0ABP4TCT1_9ACTN